MVGTIIDGSFYRPRSISTPFLSITPSGLSTNRISTIFFLFSFYHEVLHDRVITIVEGRNGFVKSMLFIRAINVFFLKIPAARRFDGSMEGNSHRRPRYVTWTVLRFHLPLASFVRDSLHRRCETREAPLPKNPLFAFG